MPCYLRTLVAIGLLLPSMIYAYDSATSIDGSTPRRIDEIYLEEAQQETGAFASIPVTHISPAFRTVTFAIEAEYLDIIVKNPDALANIGTGSNEEFLIRGYSASPYLALSLKNIGVGISGEIGHKETEYQCQYGVIDSTTTSTSNLPPVISVSSGREYGELDYSGLGVYLYLNPFPRWRRLKLTFLAGSKLLNAKQQATSQFDADNEPQDLESIKYTVSISNIGLNGSFRLSKRLRIVPWLDYSAVNTTQADSQIYAGDRSLVINRQRFTSDVQLYWHDHPDLQYGIDLTLRLKRFEIHLGGLIAALISFNDVDSQDIDAGNTVSLSFSYDLKAR